jgi:hypothetical protein
LALVTAKVFVFPMGQLTQVVDAVPTVYFPAGQSLQAVPSSLSEYFPSGQTAQAPESVGMNPAGQRVQ